MIRQGQYQRLLQKLSPQQIQLMKLLQVPTATLEERIKEELQVNPALEEGDPDENFNAEGEETNFEDEAAPVDDYADPEVEEAPAREETVELDEYLERFTEDDSDYSKTKGEAYNQDEEIKTPQAPAFEDSFHEYLEQQLGLLQLKNEKELAIAKQIIGSIDDDGYLRRDLESMADDLLFGHNMSVTVAEIKPILAKIHRFDPPGTGAKDLQECLLLQIRFKLEQKTTSKSDRPYYVIAERLIDDLFEEFSKKHYTRLQRQLNITEEDLKRAIDLILKLNPKPASGYFSQQDRGAQYIIPDFIIENRDGVLELIVDPRNAPELRVSDQYRDMLKSYKTTRAMGKSDRLQKEAVLFIKQKIDSARWFIDAIRQRENTMYNTMEAIMLYQKEYFLTGDSKKIRPMILKDVADRTGLDISTISRVANSKFVQTEYGVKRLKEFFSEALQNNDGEEISTLEVKKILDDVVKAESKNKPLSDERLKELLFEKGYNIARRTVAKYREQLNIPVARLRKEL